MSVGYVQNYTGAGSGEWIREGYDTFLLIYNETGAALSEGSLVEISFANSTTAGNYPQAVKPGAKQTTIMHLIGVVRNYKLGSAGIASAAWGLVQVRGYCPTVLQAAAVTAGDTFTTTASAYTGTDSSAATKTLASVGIAKTANSVSPYTTDAWLFGELIALVATS